MYYFIVIKVYGEHKLKKTILKTLIVVGIGIGIFSIPFFIDHKPDLIAAVIVTK